MTEEELKVENGYFESNKGFIKNIENSRNDTSKIENICNFLKSINNYLEAGVENRYVQKEMLSQQTIAIQSIIKIVKELDERIKKLENQ